MTDLSDYETYLNDETFNPIQFANELILSNNNNTSDDYDYDTLDLETPIKRLKFDLKDLNNKLLKQSNENYTSLLIEFDKLESFQHNILNDLKSSLQSINSSYNRLQLEILKPYNDANSLHLALKKLHQTSNLLRSSIYFIYLISKIEEINKSDFELNKKPFINLLNLSKLLSNLKNHLIDSNHLKSLKLIRDYESFQQIQLFKIIEITNSQFKQLKLDDNLDNELSILNLIYSSCLTSPETFFNQLQQLLSLKINQSIQLIVKNLNNTKSLDKIFKEVSKSGLLISTIDTILINNKWFDNNNKSSTTITIFDKISEKLQLNSSSLIMLYWKDIAVGIEPKFKDIINKGGPISKNLKLIYNDLKLIIIDSVLKSFDDSNNEKTVDCLEVKMMLNSINSLNITK
ncbi:hypothetical protein CANARDRAFT_9928 [[Candida] arabinofermentans NRRL YB-2248]|uniref:Conserved oligomeric Golgi complex subunit 5 n=1 Tax=[Candida] arabinofermentans NRRL YB-2248 TaxID=983967 RepID=A0A1E4SUB2_9ASCO|nr:hypothetical protein CANARDRAFT_9928 [[Candida] arabinofermentans NRRL YB-2248]